MKIIGQYHTKTNNISYIFFCEFQVCLIDTGKVVECKMNCVYKYCGDKREFIDLPARCFECNLAQLQPSQIRYPMGDWPAEAIELFKSKIDSKIVEIEVYSVTNGKANVFVHLDNSEQLNNVLIQEQYGLVISMSPIIYVYFILLN